MASDCDKEIERIAREACMMIDDWVFGNTLAEDKYPPLKECLVRVVTDALRIPGDCVRLPDGRVVRISAVGMEVLQNIADGKMAPAWPGTSSIMSAAEAARGEGST